MKRKITALAAAAIAAASGLAATSLAAPSSASASVRGCHVPSEAYGTHDDPVMNIGNLSVRNMRCSTALRAIENGWLYYPGWPPARHLGFHTRGYYCYVTKTWRAFGTVLGQQIRCVRGGTAFRWEWAT